MPHTIRLRHPWLCEPCDNGALWLRTFNWPAGILPQESAWLVIEGLPTLTLVKLNDQPLAADTPAGHFNITSTLAPHNRLAIEIAGAKPSDQTECPYDVRLEIVER